MIIVSHRVNTNDKLIGTPTHFGVEIDVRSNGGKLIVQHEPCIDGEKFESWIANFHHALLILNVKEEGLEKKLLACMKEYSIDNFFF